MIKVAGVRYDNDLLDGGENRQDILRQFIEEGRSVITVDFIYYPKNDDTFGIKLREHESGKIIGWIHKETANNLANQNIKAMTGFIANHGCYHVKLDNVRRPDKTKYKAICAECDKRNIIHPAYDERALSLDLYCNIELPVIAESDAD